MYHQVVWGLSLPSLRQLTSHLAALKISRSVFFHFYQAPVSVHWFSQTTPSAKYFIWLTAVLSCPCRRKYQCWTTLLVIYAAFLRSVSQSEQICTDLYRKSCGNWEALCGSFISWVPSSPFVPTSELHCCWPSEVFVDHDQEALFLDTHLLYVTITKPYLSGIWMLKQRHWWSCWCWCVTDSPGKWMLKWRWWWWR